MYTQILLERELENIVYKEQLRPATLFQDIGDRFHLTCKYSVRHIKIRPTVIMTNTQKEKDVKRNDQ